MPKPMYCTSCGEKTLRVHFIDGKELCQNCWKAAQKRTTKAAG